MAANTESTICRCCGGLLTPYDDDGYCVRCSLGYEKEEDE